MTGAQGRTDMAPGTADDGGSASARRAATGERVIAALSRDPMAQRVDVAGVQMFGRPDFLSAGECGDLAAMIDADCFAGNVFDPAQAQFRTSQSCNLDPAHPLVAAITERICALMRLPSEHGETLQGQRYQPGQYFRAHQDYFRVDQPYWPRMRAEGGQRTWTAMIYLNAVEGGGETAFPVLGFAVPPRPGLLLMWNNMRADGSPNPDTLHEALPVRAGRKYVVTKWFRENPWYAAS